MSPIPVTLSESTLQALLRQALGRQSAEAATIGGHLQLWLDLEGLSVKLQDRRGPSLRLTDIAVWARHLQSDEPVPEGRPAVGPQAGGGQGPLFRWTASVEAALQVHPMEDRWWLYLGPWRGLELGVRAAEGDPSCLSPGASLRAAARPSALSLAAARRAAELLENMGTIDLLSFRAPGGQSPSEAVSTGEPRCRFLPGDTNQAAHMNDPQVLITTDWA